MHLHYRNDCAIEELLSPKSVALTLYVSRLDPKSLPLLPCMCRAWALNLSPFTLNLSREQTANISKYKILEQHPKRSKRI